MYNIFIGMYGTETNRFAPGRTVLSDFGEAFDDPQTTWDERGRHTGLGGILDVLDAREDVRIVPSVRAWAEAGSLCEQSAHETILGRMLEKLDEAGPVDGVVLYLHGTMACEQEPDAEGDVLERLRSRLGPDVPIMAGLDLHANMSERMLQNADALVLFDCYPHTDIFDCCAEAARLLLQTLDGKIHPVMRARRLPMLCEFVPTDSPALSPVVERMHALEKQPGMLAASIAYGFFCADVEPCTAMAVAVSDGDGALAQQTADALADALWQQRHKAHRSFTALEQALDEIGRSEGRFVLADCNDNPGGGSPGDGTHILRALLERGVESAVIAAIFDPQTVRAAQEAGVGACFDASIGGKVQPAVLGAPVQCRVQVHSITEHAGYGTIAALKTGGMTVLVQSKRFQMFSPQTITACGAELPKITVVKSNIAYKTAFAPHVRRCYEISVPGLSVNRPADVDMHCSRPVYPLDEL